jgi:DNA-directed RNA polymerase subunit RPC12/RpoP
MLVKCICTNCAGHLEFEEQNAGETIACPHCGFKTVLELPGAKKADPEMTSLIRKLVFRRRVIAGGVALLVLAGVGFALYRWGVPWIMDRVPEMESTITAMVVLVLLCLALPFVLFWLVFPALLFFQLRRVIQLLSQSGSETSAAEPESPVESEESTRPPSHVEARSTSEEGAATR